MTPSIQQLVCLFTIMTVVCTGLASALHVEIHPATVNELITDTVTVTCKTNDASYSTLSVILMELGKKGQHPFANLKTAGIQYGSSIKSNMKADGNINEVNRTESYLKITIQNPSVEDGGVYSCLMFYLDVDGELKEGRAVANMTVDNNNDKLVINHLLGKMSKLEKIAERQEEELQEEHEQTELLKEQTKTQINQLKEQTKKQDEEIKKQDVEIQQLNEQASQQDEQTKKQDVEIQQLKEQASQQDEQTKKQDVEIQQLNEQASQQDEQTKKQDVEIQQLKEQASQQDEQTKKQDVEIQQLNEQASQQDEQTKKQDVEIQQLKEQASQQDEQTKKQDVEIQQLNEQAKKQDVEIEQFKGQAKQQDEQAKRQEATVSSKLDELMATDRNQGNMMKALTDKDSLTCAFRAGYNPRDGLVTGNTLVFSVPILDVGNDYSTTTGIFTAPKKGLYAFNLSVRISKFKWYVFVDLEADGVTVASMYVHDSYDGGQSSVSTVVSLQAGDQVRPVVRKYSGKYLDSGYRYSAFSGYLIKTT